MHETVVVVAVTSHPVSRSPVRVEHAAVPVPLQVTTTLVTVLVAHWVRVTDASRVESAIRHPRSPAQVGGSTLEDAVVGEPLTVNTMKDVVVEHMEAVFVSHSVGLGPGGNVGMWSGPTLDDKTSLASCCRLISRSYVLSLT